MEPEKKSVRTVRVEDLATTVKLKRVQARADAARAKERFKIEAATRREEAKARAEVARMEVKRMHLQMSSREAAARHLAHFAGLYMFLSVLAFLYAVVTLDESTIAVVAGLITLVVTTIGGLLRSIVTEGNGHDEEGASTPESPSDV